MQARTSIPVLLVMAAFLLSFRMPAGSPDISTPEKSFSSFVEALKTGNTDDLQRVATPTGITSLLELYRLEDYRGGMTDLAAELETSKLHWDKITDDIYFASARVDEKTHKMEFTKEEPGWMLYHWQIGGGVDKKETVADEASKE